MNFTDTEFMTAQEKSTVLKQWRTFLQSGLKKEHFTKMIYKHLHLHCGFIAHYDIHGFFSTYFESRADTQEFFDQLFNYPYAPRDYEDINKAMRIEYKELEPKIQIDTQKEVIEKIALLKVSVEMAETDYPFAVQLLNKLHL